MRQDQARKILGLSTVEVYRLGASGVIRTRPIRNGLRNLDYNDEDVYAYKQYKTGPWTIPYLCLPNSMPEDEVHNLMNRMMFFCYSKKYKPVLPVSVDMIAPNVPFGKYYKLRNIMRRAADKKLERLVVADPDLLKKGSFLYDCFFYTLTQLGLKEIVVANLNLN